MDFGGSGTWPTGRQGFWHLAQSPRQGQGPWCSHGTQGQHEASSLVMLVTALCKQELTKEKGPMLSVWCLQLASQWRAQGGVFLDVSELSVGPFERAAFWQSGCGAWCAVNGLGLWVHGLDGGER